MGTRHINIQLYTSRAAIVHKKWVCLTGGKGQTKIQAIYASSENMHNVKANKHYIRVCEKDFAVQLNTKLDISLSKIDNFQQQISTLGNRLTSLEGAFSSFTVDVNRSVSELRALIISRFDAVQANFLSRSEAAHGKIVLLRSALS